MIRDQPESDDAPKVLAETGYNTLMNSMTFLRCSVLPMLLLVLSACSSVSSVHLVGRPLGEDLSKDLSGELKGSWMGPKGNLLLIHCDPEGVLSFASTGWKEDEGKFQLESEKGILRAIKDHLVINIEQDEGAYDFFLIWVRDDQLAVWSPDVGAFQKLVSDEKLAGRVEEGSPKQVILTGDSEELAAALEKLEMSKLFEWADPALVLVRIKD